ncbi:MAG: putative glycosyltransferase EpsJ [Flavobacteriaceae bacterium]|nr:MAG: putative glycosyltransferase EpsJ [Flavobacteriaceae bacterium]|tara:strand:- start:3084 stop:4022 length:939 start_codon:yes stop_codon:yes gene_type:complete
MPLISVVIPLYNKQDYILRTIASVLNQSFSDFELLVIDDGSTDRSIELLSSVSDSRLRIHTHSNSGVSYTRNKGIELANSDIIAFLDADDTWNPDFLLTIMRLYNKYPAAVAFSTNYERVLSDGSIRTSEVFGIDGVDGNDGLITNFFKMSLYEMVISNSHVAIKKSVIKNIGGYLEGVRYGEDQEFFARLALRFPFAYSKKVEGQYYKDVYSSTSQVLMSYEMPIIDLYMKYKAAANLNSDQEYYLEEYINRHRLDKCFWALIKGKGSLAKKLLKDSKNTELFKDKWLRYNLISKIPYSLYMAFRKLKSAF